MAEATEVSNIAFLKNISGLTTILDDYFPRGWKSILRRMNKPAADKLSRNADISADIAGKCFITDSVPNYYASVEEMNVFMSSVDLFTDITEMELMELTDKREWDSPHAPECRAGRAIDAIICDWNNFIDFDCDYYYHCRKYDEGKPFYTETEMRKAPEKYVGNGRYNYSGNSNFYFANTEQGARSEINKHNRKALIQTAKLKPRKHIKMIDLCAENKKRIALLDYIRRDADVSAVMPPEYRVPQFVCSCCRNAHIEGIKYYGSKKYDNYVSWEDDYFDFVDMWR